MASTIKVTNIDTPDGSGNITVDRPLSGSGASLTALNATQLTSGTIPIARIADDAITLAKMAGGTDGQIITYDASGNPVAVGPGTDGQVLTSTGAGSPPAFETVSAGPTSATVQATTSAGSKTFSGIPSGTTNIIISWNEISTVATTSMEVRLGDSGGVESTGYVSTGLTLTQSANPGGGDRTTGFFVRLQNASYTLSGHMLLTLLDASSNLWISSLSAKVGTISIITGGGSKSLSAELTQLYIVLDNGSYDAGSINIMYW